MDTSADFLHPGIIVALNRVPVPDEVFYGAKQNFPPEETPADAGIEPAPEEEQDLEEYGAAINERRHLTRF